VQCKITVDKIKQLVDMCSILIN